MLKSISGGMAQVCLVLETYRCMHLAHRLGVLSLSKETCHYAEEVQHSGGGKTIQIFSFIPRRLKEPDISFQTLIFTPFHKYKAIWW